MSVIPKFYNHNLYTEELKSYVKRAVRIYFNNVYFNFSEFYNIRYMIRTKYINDIIEYTNLTPAENYVDIVYQYCILYLIDHITTESPEMPINFSQDVTYDGYNAIIDRNKYNVDNFPNGFIIMPSLVPKEIVKRMSILFSYLLTDNQNNLKFSLTESDTIFGDEAPSVIKCIINGIMDELYEKFISSIPKTKVIIPTFRNMNLTKMISSDVNEIILLFEYPTEVKIKELDMKVLLPEGSIAILNSDALTYNIGIENLERTPARMLIFS